MSLDVDVYSTVVFGYVVPNTLPTDADEKKVYMNNAKAKNSILVGFSQNELIKAMKFKSTKDVW